MLCVHNLGGDASIQTYRADGGVGMLDYTESEYRTLARIIYNEYAESSRAAPKVPGKSISKLTPNIRPKQPEIGALLSEDAILLNRSQFTGIKEMLYIREDTLHIGFARIDLHLPDNHSLKGRRQVSRSVTSRVRDRFNVSIAEVDNGRLWQRLTLGVCCLGADPDQVEQIIARVATFIDDTRPDLELLDCQSEIISGL